MYFIADLHIHSRFSRATAKSLNLPNLYIAARQKGIHVLGTGDFTHPGWFSEIREQLVPAEPGLFRLRPELEAECEEQIQVSPEQENGDEPVRFMLTCEISNIYKKEGITRKTHNLILLPDLSEAARFNSRMEQIGNIRSDGRPILGLDTRDLLEILLETSEKGFFIPAHIWTPWFSMLGSKSGFDSVRACFGDLTPHIFAVETGLSSDPPMNWRVGDLDGLTLVSNSDAHSPANLAREANLFDTELSFYAIRDALETGDPWAFKGTIEFFPQEGKYHQDGHRKCCVNLHPKEAIRRNLICPVCGHPLTLGVLHRVEALATRAEGEKPEKTHPYYSVIPLPEILSEIVGTGPKSKKVQAACQRIQLNIGAELAVLHTLPIETIDAAGMPLLTEAIRRMRAGQVHITPGFDGQYGEIKVFDPKERDRLIGQQSLFAAAAPEAGKGGKKAEPSAKNGSKKDRKTPEPQKEPLQQTKESAQPNANDLFSGLNPEQEHAVSHGSGPLLLVAGPGTGKTRTLTCRIARLINTQTVRPDQILALTFTNKAAGEMCERLARFCGTQEQLPLAATFHAFCLRFLKETGSFRQAAVIDETERAELVSEAMAKLKSQGRHIPLRAEGVLERIIAAKQQILGPRQDLTAIAKDLDPEILNAVYQAYQNLLEAQQLYDYEDLIFHTVGVLESDQSVRDTYRSRFPYVFVDEYQDLNYGQYLIIRALSPPDGNICVIGDPDQSIYGFRGSDVKYFREFARDFPGAQQIRLHRNYRSAETILEAAHQVIRSHSLNTGNARVSSGIEGPATVEFLQTVSEKAEAVAIGKRIEEMVGGTGMDFDDFGGHEQARHGSYRAFSDFAVLFRTRAQGEILAETFSRAGIPFQMARKSNIWRRKGVQEILACLKLIEGCATYGDLELCMKTLAPDITQETIETVKNLGLAQKLPVSGLLAETERTQTAGLSPAAGPAFEDFLATLAGFSRDMTGLTVPGKMSYLKDKPEFAAACRAEGADEAFARIFAMAEAFGEDAAAFIESAALQSDPDVYDRKSQKVALLTMHAAKGLEFPIVLIAGCEDGLIPLHSPAKPAADPREERRLFYVAMTRAGTQLILTQAKRRRIYGTDKGRAPSPYISDIDKELLCETVMEKKYRQPAYQQLNLF
ncbi:MAG: UvrD-helicase domain-containing protein [Desulfosalsimonadaceae bacterium]